MTTTMSAVKTVGLWGATQVGKTTMLATALFGNDPVLAPVVRGDAGGEVNRQLFDVYRRLMNNQWVQATASDTVRIPLRGNGTAVDLVDVRGRVTVELNKETARDIVRDLDAVLFLVEYDGQETGNQILAIDGAVVELGDKPMALAFTKCECSLPSESPLWDRPEGWLQRTPLWVPHQRTLQRFEGHAWPTSAFGYDEVTGLPAVILGEMGQLLPYRIQPRNVTHPFISIFRMLGGL
jgi:hypothetical protein